MKMVMVVLIVSIAGAAAREAMRNFDNYTDAKSDNEKVCGTVGDLNKLIEEAIQEGMDEYRYTNRR